MPRSRLLKIVSALCALALAASPLVADPPTTKPSSPPATRPAEEQVAQAPSTEVPVRADDGQEQQTTEQKKFPTPAELIRQMKERKAAEQARTLVAQIDFSMPMSEQPAPVGLFGETGFDLRTVLGRLAQAEQDESCHAVLLTFFNGGMMNYAQAQELRSSLDRLRKANKRTFVYADTFDTMSYLVASAATDVVLMDGGEVFIPGVAIEPMFYRGALDKLGIVPDYVQIGEYKGAEEPYTRKKPSEELAGEMNQLADALYEQIVDHIAVGRDIQPSQVRKLIDRAMIPAADAVKLGLVDHLADADGLRGLMKEELSNDVRIESEYGVEEAEGGFDPDNPFSILAMMQPQEPEIAGPSIALIYAEGVITGGESGSGGLFGESGVGSETIRRAIRMAERDDNVKAIVIRIDSPGGSALASEAMYQSVRRVAETKPVIISIGGMAASGGYYLAVAGDHIIADPAAIVGSIGVVGGKLVLSGLYEKLGLTTATFARGQNANLFSDSEEWDNRQRRMVRDWMTNTYDQFTDRVMSTREGKIQDIDAVARGRIFLAKDARSLGMVDELGGIELALERAAEQAELEEYDVVVLPGQSFNPLAGMGFPFGQVASPETRAMLELIPPHVRQALGRMIQLGRLLEERPVVLMSPYVIRVQ
jgi:protease-4